MQIKVVNIIEKIFGNFKFSFTKVESTRKECHFIAANDLSETSQESFPIRKLKEERENILTIKT